MNIDLLNELASFLNDPKEEVRQQACSHIASFTKNDDAMRLMCSGDAKIVRSLKHLCLDRMEIAHDAFKALINISADIQRCSMLDDMEFISNIVKLVIHPKFLIADLGCMLLSNMTKSHSIARKLMQTEIPDITGLYMLQLLEAFVRGSTHNPNAEFHFLASVFGNVSLTKEGREFFTSRERNYPIKKVLCFLGHPNLIRRGGSVVTVKNCCFLVDVHEEMYSAEKVNVVPAILYQLAGPEELSEEDMDGMPEELQYLEDTKQREPDACLRRQLIESLLLLTTTRGGREHMRATKVYPIIREMHLVETDTSCEETTHELVQMLMRDESDSETITDEEEQDNVVVETLL